jgi:SAM-dependent methyltransferase
MLWRRHSDAVNGALCLRWLSPNRADRLLKTDLFDEACAAGLAPFLSSLSRSVMGIDLSSASVRRARARHPGVRGQVADVRRLPFADASLDAVVSNSTLDHFRSRRDIAVSLGEIHRVLRCGGRLLITLDNLANPIIALRNALPFSWLCHLGIVRYYVGASCGPGELCTLLREQGFVLQELDAVLHHPSVIAVTLSRLLQHRATPGLQQRFLASLMALERLSRLPTRFRTGHYVAALATKR